MQKMLCLIWTMPWTGLTGQIEDVPYDITSNILIMEIQDTSLQNSCAEAGRVLPFASAAYCLKQYGLCVRAQNAFVSKLLPQHAIAPDEAKHACCIQT